MRVSDIINQMQQDPEQNLCSAQNELVEPWDDAKFNLMTTPLKQRENDSNGHTNQIVWLLNQCIHNKIDWDHQKLLLWNESACEPPSFQEIVSSTQEAIESEINLQCGQEDHQEILNQKQEMRTPEFLHPDDPLSPIRFYLSLPNQQPDQKEQGEYAKCNCKKSMCLKMYCECFRAGRQCKDCGCKDCKNNSRQQVERKKAIETAREREPTAFSGISQYKGCRCSKSQCLKGYCECFLNGHTCGKYCRCRGCLNCKKAEPSRRKRNNN